jgi:DNA-directed RNA polymerase subunit H
MSKKTQQNTSILVSDIFKARKTILELMEKQNYDVADYVNFSISEVNSMNSNNQLDLLLETHSNFITEKNQKKKIYIHHFLNKKLAVRNLQQIIDDLFISTETLNTGDTLFIITKNDPNETILAELNHLWESENIFIVIENIQQLKFNILNHKLVPPHRVMSEEEVANLMFKYNITNLLSELPEISRFDPVARVIGLRPNQVCHIIRPSKTAIYADYYRVCV